MNREEKLRQREQRKKEQRAAAKRALSQQDQLADLVSGAHERTSEHARVEKLTPVGPMADRGLLNDVAQRQYYREFKRVTEASDVCLEVLDARDPMGCRCLEAERLIRSQGKNKRIILVLNKIDLVPKAVVLQWLKKLRNEFPTIAFKASTQNQKNNLGRNDRVSADKASDASKSRHECLGGDTLIQLLKNYSRNLNIKTSISVGVIGFPNVGKSSLINSLKRSRVANVGATPGMTKVAQEIHLDKKVKLLDSPGIVFTSAPDASTALRNCVKVEKLQDPITPVGLILDRCNHEQLMRLYRIGEFSSTNDFLLQIAEKQGKVKKGGVLDMEKAARTVLEDWNSGRIPYYTVPDPDDDAGVHVGSEIVTEWAAAFDIDSLVEREEQAIEVLDAPNSDGLVEMSSAGPDSGLLPTDPNDETMDDAGQDEQNSSSAAASVEMHMGSRQKLGTRRRDEAAPAGSASDREVGMSQTRDRKKALKAVKRGERRAMSNEAAQGTDGATTSDKDGEFDFDNAGFGFGQQQAPADGGGEETADVAVDMAESEDDYGFDSDDM
eukprot:COSAG06_NODE_595_length_13930_cov_54.274962_10_plen_553_part_00